MLSSSRKARKKKLEVFRGENGSGRARNESFGPVNDFATKTQLSFRKAHYKDGYLNECTAIEGTEREHRLNKALNFTDWPVFERRTEEST